MRRLGLVAAGAVLAAGSLLTACSTATDATSGDGKGTAASAPAPKKSAAPAASKDVKITRAGFEDHDTWGPHAYVVHYEVTNHGDKAADYFAQLEFLDRDGDHLGSTGITADKLGPGKSKRGDTAPVDAEIENGKIKDIASVRVTQVDRT
jgi:hypothetical protein